MKDVSPKLRLIVIPVAVNFPYHSGEFVSVRTAPIFHRGMSCPNILKLTPVYGMRCAT